MKPSATSRAEAAAWVARLHGPNRTPEAEAGFRKWLSEDPERATAFELLTDTWERSARLRRRPSEIISSFEQPGFRLTFSRAALAALAISIVAAIGTAFYLHSDGVSTAIGEQRTLSLEDGTRVYLNTNSRAIVHYDNHARGVELEKGEAFFEVAKHEDWPFIVTAGDRQVRALGTSFIVRRDPDQLAVTVVEGKVAVSPASNDPYHAARSRTHTKSPVSTLSEELSQREGDAPDIYSLTPGERLTFADGEPPQLDQPSIERVTAWQRGQVVLDNTALDDAVAEMNRYSTTKLTVEHAAANTIRVSGIFRAGDSDNFAQAVARSYGLKVTNGPSEIRLTGAARAR